MHFAVECYGRILFPLWPTSQPCRFSLLWDLCDMLPKFALVKDSEKYGAQDVYR